MEAPRLGDRPLGVAGEVRIDLDRDVAVLALSFVPDRAEHVAGVADVLLGQTPEDLLRIVYPAEGSANLFVVETALRDRLLEDGRVRGDADDRVVAHQPLELAGLEHLAGEKVDPDTLAERRELVKS